MFFLSGSFSVFCLREGPPLVIYLQRGPILIIFLPGHFRYTWLSSLTSLTLSFR